MFTQEASVKLCWIFFFSTKHSLLPSYLERMEKIDEAIEANFEIIKIICEDQQIFVNDDRPLAKVNPIAQNRACDCIDFFNTCIF